VEAYLETLLLEILKAYLETLLLVILKAYLGMVQVLEAFSEIQGAIFLPNHQQRINLIMVMAKKMMKIAMV
jgi:hypothetical protein